MENKTAAICLDQVVIAQWLARQLATGQVPGLNQGRELLIMNKSNKNEGFFLGNFQD